MHSTHLSALYIVPSPILVAFNVTDGLALILTRAPSTVFQTADTTILVGRRVGSGRGGLWDDIYHYPRL